MAGCVGAELLEFGKEVFNEMAGLVYILELVKGTSGHHRLCQAGQIYGAGPTGERQRCSSSDFVCTIRTRVSG